MKRQSVTLPNSGGKHQRIARFLAVTALSSQDSSPEVSILSGPVRPCNFLEDDAEVKCLLELWALGLLSAVLLQTIAASACQVAPRPAMRILAQLGGAGSAPGNAHRDLQRQLQLGTLDVKVAGVWSIDFPLRDVSLRPGKFAQTGVFKYPVMMPHELMHCLFTSHRHVFDRYILGSCSPSEFWSNVPEEDDRFVGHPAKRLAKDMLIPLRLHGDGVPVGKVQKRSFDVVSCSSMIGGEGATWDTRYFCSAL